MKKKETAANLWTSTSARLLSAFLLVAPCAVGLGACGDDEKDKPGTEQDAGERCGNGVIDEGEQCDGAVMPDSAPEGAVCNANCQGWSVDAPAECGNGAIEDGEVCDGEALPEGAPATAKCKADCSGLEACGNGAIDEGEECDPGAALPDGTEEGSACLDTCEIKGPNCGNGAIDEGEECDPAAELPAAYPTDAVCLESCKVQFCGNNRIEGDEMCDGTALPEGIPTGVVCEDDCTIKTCGNGVIDEGEECDPFAAVPQDLNGTPVLEGSVCTDACLIDQCPEDDEKLAPGQCGCGTADDDVNTADLDDDGVIACLDACPEDEWKSGKAGEDDCKCGETKVDGKCYLNINTAKDLLDLNRGTAAILKKNINLGDVLDVLVDESGASARNEATWKPLFEDGYAATLLGNDKTITATNAAGALSLQCAAEAEATEPIPACGLFAEIGTADVAGHVEDLFIDLTIQAKESLTAGLVAGRLTNGTLNNVHVKGHLGWTSSADPDPLNPAKIGGLVGVVEANGKIDFCSANMKQLKVYYTHTASVMSGARIVGGLIGHLEGSAYNVWAEGEISIDDRDFNSSTWCGGLVGEIKNTGELANAYALSQITVGKLAVAVLMGKLAGQTLGKGWFVRNVYAIGALANNSDSPTNQMGGMFVEVNGTGDDAAFENVYWLKYDNDVEKGLNCIFSANNSYSNVCGELKSTPPEGSSIPEAPLGLFLKSDPTKELVTQLNAGIQGAAVDTYLRWKNQTWEKEAGAFYSIPRFE